MAGFRPFILGIMSQVFYHCATRLNHSKTHSPFFTEDFRSHSKHFSVNFCFVFAPSPSGCGKIWTLYLRIMSQVLSHHASKLNNSKTHSLFFTQDFCSHSKHFSVKFDSENQLQCCQNLCVISALSLGTVAGFKPSFLGLWVRCSTAVLPGSITQEQTLCFSPKISLSL